MTIKELYQWAIENNIEDYDIKICDDAYGWYYHIDSGGLEIDDANEEVIIG